jgi:hypothetical protein
MIKIIDGNGTGKTRRLMEAAAAADGVFVCSDAQRYREKSRAYGISNLEIVSYTDFFINNYSPEKAVFINKIDKYLAATGEVAGFSLTV